MRATKTIGNQMITVTAERHVVRAWQEAIAMGTVRGFDHAATHYFAVSVSELANNLVRHATEGGTVTIGPIGFEGKVGVEVVAADSGPGIANLSLALSDGHSSKGGLGNGLPAVRRMMHEFEIDSGRRRGNAHRRQDVDVVRIGIACHALHDAPHCGDRCAYWRNGPRINLCIADGLGHGEPAQEAAVAALAYVAEHLDEPLTAVFEGCDRAIFRSRGVAMALAVADVAAEQLTCAAIGNTRGLVLVERNIRLNGSNGIVGAGFRSLRPLNLPFRSGDVLILWTDGIEEHVDPSRFDRGVLAEPQSLADAMVGHYGRGMDDVGVLAFRSDVGSATEPMSNVDGGGLE